MPACPPARAGMRFFAEIGKTGLTNAAMRGIIYLAFAGVAHLVERDLAKVEVASSSLVARSKKERHPHGCLSFLEQHFCYAKVVACGRVTEREWGNPQRFPPHTPPSLRYARVRTTKPVGNHKKKNHPKGGFSFWNAVGRLELAASTGAPRGEPFRRGRRPRRPVSAAVPRWERIPTPLRAAKQVPLGYSSE